MTELKLVVPNISCSHCVNAVVRRLKSVDGVTSVSGDAGSKAVCVSYDAPAGERAIREALAEIGYPALEA